MLRKSRNQQSKFVVCMVVRRSEFSTCSLRDRCSFLKEYFVSAGVCTGVYTVCSWHLRANQPVTDISNIHSSAELVNVLKCPLEQQL